AAEPVAEDVSRDAEALLELLEPAHKSVERQGAGSPWSVSGVDVSRVSLVQSPAQALQLLGACSSTTRSASPQPGWIGATYLGWSDPMAARRRGASGSVVF